MVSRTRCDIVRRHHETINHSHNKTHSEFPEGETTPTCTVCPVTKYSDVSSNGPCTSCGSGTTTSTGSTSASQCICNVGYYLDGSSCRICPVGSSTHSTGSTSLSECNICAASSTFVDGKCVFSTADVVTAYYSANAGNNIAITTGTYSAGEFRITKAVGITCQEGHTCTFDGMNSHRVMWIYNVGSAMTSLTKLIITRGYHGGRNYGGGGLYIDIGDVTMTECEISGNTAGNVGGGLYIQSSDVTMTKCEISGNTASIYGSNRGVSKGLKGGV